MKKIFSILIAAVLLMQLAACTAPQGSVSAGAPESAATAEVQPAGAVAGMTEDGQWLNSNLLDNITADMDIRPQDNFAAYVNKDWLVNTKIKETAPSVTAFDEASDTVREQIISLLEGEPLESHEGQLVQTLYAQFVDMETRDALGTAPIQPVLDQIDAIDSIEDVTAFLKSNTMQTLVNFSLEMDNVDSTKYLLQLLPTKYRLGNADRYNAPSEVGERIREGHEMYTPKAFALCGYTAAQGAADLAAALALEAELAKGTIGLEAQAKSDFLEKTYNPYTIEELAQLQGNFPAVEILQSVYGDAVQMVCVYDTVWLGNLSAVYDEAHLDALKALLRCEIIASVGNKLTSEMKTAVDEYVSIINGTTLNSDVKEVACGNINELLGMAMGRVYADAFVSEESKQEVLTMMQEIVDAYKVRLAAVDWLSEETLAAAMQKLDAMTMLAAYPDDWSAYDYSALTLKSYAQGGNLIESITAIHQYRRAKEAEKLRKGAVDDGWFLPPQTVNAYYDPQKNAINVLAGIMNAPIFTPGDTEGNMATLGIIIGHEISHGFDRNGSQFDVDGNMVDWWTSEDKAAFEQRSQALVDYYSQIEVLADGYVNGQLTLGENTADLGGMAVVLDIVRERENFDYKAFFEKYAAVWRAKMPAAQIQSIMDDEHAPEFVRVNAVVQQFDEFYEAFDVQPGDGMYVAPEDRLAVW